MRASLEISLFGGFEVWENGQRIGGFDSDKSRALLAYLAVESERAHRREKLAGLLWPESSERQARHNLSQALYNVRMKINDPARPVQTQYDQPYLQANQKTIQFNKDANSWLDTAVFQEGLNGCQDHIPNPSIECDGCLDLLTAAADIYKGEFFAGFSLPGCPDFESWVTVERERFHRGALAICEMLAAHLRRAGELSSAHRYALRAVALDPLWEPARRQLMLCLWLAGNRAEAQTAYEALRSTLAAELGVEPDAESQRLAKRIQADVEVISPHPEGRHNLPHALTPFIGRNVELDLVQAKITTDASRLVTLLGPGGAGKSRLAVEAARRNLDRFPDGVYLVSLSQLSSVAAIVPALAKVLELSLGEDKDPEEQLLDYLREKKLLLIMDSFEGILNGALLAVSILRVAPQVKILATSRVRLGVKGETLQPVGGLNTPDNQGSQNIQENDAVKLFFSAAQRVIPGYTANEDDIDAIAKICRIVQGMPLGIILATAWLEMLSPTEIAIEIEKSLDFLAVDWPDLPERQRSLRATLAYSWHLLDSSLQGVLSALSIFRGSFAMAAASEIAGATPQNLLTLVDRSLVQRIAAERCAIHNTVRQFAAERLADSAEVLGRVGQLHCDYFIGRIEECIGALKDYRQQKTLEDMDLESANFSAAWAWAVANQKVGNIYLAMEGLGLYYEMRVRFRQGEDAFKTAVEMIRGKQNHPDQLCASILLQTWQARFHRLLGNADRAALLREACLAQMDACTDGAADSVRARAFIFLEMGHGEHHNDHGAAHSWYQKSLEQYQVLEDDWSVATVLAGLAGSARYLGDFTESIRLAEESLTIFRNLNDPRGVANTLIVLANSLVRQGHHAEGEQCIRETIDLFDALGDRAGKVKGLINMARMFFWQGRLDEMVDLFEQSLPISRDLGLRHDTAFAFALQGVGLWLRADYERASFFSEEANSLAKVLEYHRMIGSSYWSLGGVAVAQGNYTQAIDLIRQAIAYIQDLGQLDELASIQATLACAQLKAGDADGARRQLLESLEICKDICGIWGTSYTLPIAALYLAENGRYEKAVEVYTLICQYPIVANSKFHEEIAGTFIYEAAAALPHEAVREAEERGREGDPFEMAAELLTEL